MSAKWISIEEIIRRYQPGQGRHWFDRDTLRFFRSRLPQGGLESEHGVFFVTSEQPPHGRRQYSVRKLVGPGDIDTVGAFCSMTRGEAHGLCKRSADGKA